MDVLRHLHRAARKARLFGFTLLLGALAACDSGPGESLYDEDAQLGPDPVVSGITPAGFAFAGVDTVVITGQNFPADTSMAIVFFDDVPAEIVSATPTELRVKAPNVVGENVAVRVARLDAEAFGTMSYRLDPVFVSFGDIIDIEESFGLGSDAEGNLYTSMFSEGVSIGIKKITPEGVRSDFVASTFKWDDLEVGPDGALYGVRNLRAVFQFAGEGSQQATWAALPNNSASGATRLLALDFDAAGNLWTGGDGGTLYRIAPDKSFEGFPFEGTIRDLAFWNGALYVAATRGTASAVYRIPAGGGVPGTPEVLADVSGRFEGAEALSLVVAADGTVIVGMSGGVGLAAVAPGGGVSPMYSAVLTWPVTDLAWGEGEMLYASLERPTGVDAGARLVRINARMQGMP